MYNLSNPSNTRRHLWTILAVALVTVVLLVKSGWSWSEHDATTTQSRNVNAFIESQLDETEPHTKKDGYLSWVLKKKRRKKWPSSKGFPCISPSDFVTLENAIYSKGSARYLLTQTNGRYKIVSTIKFRRWKAFAATGPRRRLFFVFRGATTDTTKFRLIVNLGMFKKDKKKLERWIVRRTKEYQKKGYRLYAYIGLSAGGHFANRLKAIAPVWRLSLNGYNCKGKTDRINLRSTDDWLTSKKDLNYLTVPFAVGGHGMEAFEKMLNMKKIRDWRKVHDEFKQWKRCRGPGRA